MDLIEWCGKNLRYGDEAGKFATSNCPPAMDEMRVSELID